MNSPSRGSGVTSPAAGMRHLPTHRIPTSSKDASSALVHLDLPHGSVEGAIGWEFVVVGALRSVPIAGRNEETEICQIGGSGGSVSLVAPRSCYIAVVTRHFRELLLR